MVLFNLILISSSKSKRSNSPCLLDCVFALHWKLWFFYGTRSPIWAFNLCHLTEDHWSILPAPQWFSPTPILLNI